MNLMKIIAITIVVSFIFFSFGLSDYVSTADAQIPAKRSTMPGEIANAYLDNIGNLILLISADLILADINNAKHFGGYLTKYNFGELFAIGGFVVAVSLSIDLESAKGVYKFGELQGGGGRSWEQTLLASSISPFVGGAVGLLIGGAIEEEPLVGGIIGFAVGAMLSPIGASIGYNHTPPMEQQERRLGLGREYNPSPEAFPHTQTERPQLTVTVLQKRF